MHVYELFDGSGPGAYWFYAPGPKLWVVADLDTGKASHVKHLVRVDLTDDLAELALHKVALAMVGPRAVVRRDDVLKLLRDYPSAFDPNTMITYEEDGTEFAGPKCGETLLRIAGTLRKAKRDHG